MNKKNLLQHFRWIVLPFLLFGLTSAQAQSFISPDDAMVKLELKLSDIYEGAEEGSILPIDKAIAKKFINEAAWQITNKQPITVALDTALKATKKEYALYVHNVTILKDEISTLLERE
ncbi:MAG: hypothetical protein AB8F74_23540 [Saprospiraceae bacterium]